MIPAQAVPCPKSSSCGSVSTVISSPSSTIAAYSTRPPTAGWSASTPLSITATLTPLPVLPPHAHSRVICSGGPIRSRVAQRVRLERGRPGRPQGQLGLGPGGTRRRCAGCRGRPGELRLAGLRDLAHEARELERGAKARIAVDQRAESAQLLRDRAFDALFAESRGEQRAGVQPCARLLDRDGRLVGEQAERVEVGRRERGRPFLVEQLERADHAVLVEERHAHDAVGHVADALADVLRPARVAARAA